MKEAAVKKTTAKKHHKLSKKEFEDITGKIKLLGQEKITGCVILITEDGPKYKVQGKISNMSILEIIALIAVRLDQYSI